MRLNRLDLTRYGKFTGHVIDFGARVPGRPDLHIVYGPNEAGKSTAFAAFLDLLFGIETRSGYNFLHPYPTMRIGAALEIGGVAQDVVRIKRAQNSLLDGRDQPIAEGTILGELGGIDRDAYRTMFSLDDETLEAGGKSILASKGDLGQLLFSASAGLADLSRTLDDLKAEADRFYRFKARTGDLAKLKEQIGTLKTERAAIDTLANDYARLVEERDIARRHYEEVIAARGEIQTRLDEIGRHLGALPRLAALRGLRERRAPLAHLPEAPLQWRDDFPALAAEEIELAVRTQALDDEIAEARARHEGIVVDETALAQSDRVERLADLRARQVTADKDLPDRRLRLRDAEAAVAGLLRRLEREGEAQPQALVLGASLTGRLRELIESRSGILADVKTALSERAAAHRRLEEAQAKLPEAAMSPDLEPVRQAAMVRLYAAVAAARADDFAARRRLAERKGADAKTLLADRLRDLRPWQGDAEGLADLQPPDTEMLGRWKAGLAEAQKRLDHHAAEVERLTTEQRRFDAERAAIGSHTGLVTDRQAADVRAARDAAWAAHRRALDAASAGLFETALERDDHTTQGRFGHMADLAALRQVGRTLAVTEAEGREASARREAAAAAVRAIEAEVDAAARTLSPALAALALPALEAWLVRYTKAIEARAQARLAERERQDAEADGQSLAGRLTAALAAVGVSPPSESGFDALLATAQACLDRETELRSLRDALGERRREVADREGGVARTEAEDRAWQMAWAGICSACWLGAAGEAPSVATVREMLPALAELASVLKDKAGLADRIDKMDNDQAVFRQEVLALAAAIDLTDATGNALDLARRVTDRVAQAKGERARREAEAAKLEELETRRRGLGQTLALHRRRRDDMTSFFGVETLVEVGRTLLDTERRAELESQAAEAERDVIEAMRLPTIEVAEQVLEGADRAAFEAELARLQARFTDLDQRRLDLFSAHGKALDRVEAIGGDARVAAIEERRRTILLEIEDGALRYLKLRVGIVAAEQALRAYRDRHRSSMMDTASKAFSTISRGAYSGLATQPDKDGETLIAISASGASKEATELSKGTCFQLYLALRVAGYHEFAGTRRPVPFIADDIMETFDDFRAEEAFRLFGQMAGVGQVIYLTHHRHLCQIAQSVCPGATIHEIASG